MLWTLTICLSSHFNAFFQVKINKMWNFCLKLWFFRNYLSYRLKTCAIGFGMPQILNMHHSTHFDAFSQSKSTKCEFFAWNCDFSGTTYHRDLKQCHCIQHALKDKCEPLKPFWCIFPSQNQQNVKFLAVCLTPHHIKWKENINLNREKGLKRLKNLHI